MQKDNSLKIKNSGLTKPFKYFTEVVLFMKTINDIEVREAEYAQSRSGAKISFFELLSDDDFKEFIEGAEGFRSYLISGIAKANETTGVGSIEFHRKGKEILYVASGGLDWFLEDVDGNKRTLNLREGQLVFYLPPNLLHQYAATVGGTMLIAQRTTVERDTYGEKEFRELQKTHIA